MGLYIWYQNDFHSRISFSKVWSFCCIHIKKTEWLNLKVVWLARFLYQMIYACSAHPRLNNLRFSIQKEVYFQCWWYQNKILYHNGDFIQNKNWNELIPEWLYFFASVHLLYENLQILVMWLHHYHLKQNFVCDSAKCSFSGIIKSLHSFSIKLEVKRAFFG